MKRDIHQPQCVGCHFSHYTGGQQGYAEQKGIPLTQSCAIYCTVKHEYVFKNFSCPNYVKRHEEIR
ncbi:hypothetical protein [Emticicia fontis]